MPAWAVQLKHPAVRIIVDCLLESDLRRTSRAQSKREFVQRQSKPQAARFHVRFFQGPKGEESLGAFGIGSVQDRLDSASENTIFAMDRKSGLRSQVLGIDSDVQSLADSAGHNPAAMSQTEARRFSGRRDDERLAVLIGFEYPVLRVDGPALGQGQP